MKILQVIQVFSPMHGGSAEVAYHLSKELAKRGHEVTIYTSDFKLTQEYMNCIPEVKVCSFKTWLNLAKFYVTPGMIKSAKEEIKHFDVIHMHNYRTFQNIIVHHYAKKCGIPYVLQAHGDLPRMIEKQRLKKLYDLVFGYGILRDATKVIALTKTMVEQYKQMGVNENRIAIIPNGVDLFEYNNLPEEGGFRKKYSIIDDEKIILYLGRIHKGKGIDLLVKAFVDLIKELDDAKLVITGPDDGFLSTLKGQIEDLKIADRILLTGPLFGREKLEAYVDADVYVLPSIYETFGVTVLEACACGTPVIVTDRCGIADFVGGNVGYVVEYDKDKLRDSIFKILSDEELRRRLGEQGKRLVREECGWDGIVRKVEGIYKNIVLSLGDNDEHTAC